jgi:hypothetical protein
MNPDSDLPVASASRRRVRNDVIVLVAGAIVAFFLLARFDAFERYAAWSRSHESMQLDELLTLAVIVAVALAVFAWRRWMDLAREQKLRAEAESSARRLEGMLPICSSCKRIREQDDLWTPVEQYFSVRIAADFTHGLCPECRERLYPELTR